MTHLISRKAGRRMAAFTVAAVCAWLLAAPMIPHYSAAALAEANMLTAVYVYDGSKVTYREEDAASLDQMFYAFALFRKGHVSGAHWKNIKKFQAFTQKHPEIMPILSVGGWGADGFSQAASTAEGRATFVSDVLALMEKYGFLGVDIDWEYPGSSAAGIESSPEDRENYTLLLQAMRAGLDERTARDGIPRRLCIAISSSPELMAYLECDKIGATVDQVNLMTYDLQAEGVASHHTPLYGASESYPQSVDLAVPLEAFVVDGCRGAGGEVPGCSNDRLIHKEPANVDVRVIHRGCVRVIPRLVPGVF